MNFYRKKLHFWKAHAIGHIKTNLFDNDKLNLLYIENQDNEVAIRVNGKLTDSISVNNVVMQGSVWGSLKCTVLIGKNSIY